MRLRTISGTRWPATCADGCGTRIPPGPEVKVVVDFDSRPRKTWIPEHSPDAGTWRKDPPKEDAKASSPSQEGFQPAGAFRVPPEASPKAPEPPKAPSPTPSDVSTGHVLPKDPGPSPSSSPRSGGSFGLALLGSAGAAETSPNPAAGVPWATASLTFNAGSFESARAGLADYAQPGESCEQLRARVNRLVLEDLERSVRAMRELHERLGDTPIRTLSPARAAGAPSGASAAFPSSPPSSARASVNPPRPGTAGGEARPACPRGPEVGANLAPAVADLAARVNLELSDASVRRKRHKEAATRKFLELRGLRTLRECSSADLEGLQALVALMDRVNEWDLHAAVGVPPPTLDERLVLAD